MNRNLPGFISVIFLLSFLLIPETGLAQRDNDQISYNGKSINSNDGILSSAEVTYINEDFSGASVTTPPAGWTQYIIAGEAGVDLWHFDNPGGRPINQPMSTPTAVFDSYNYSNNGQPENVALESPGFSPPANSIVLLEWHQYLNAAAGGRGDVEVWNGTTWVTAYSATTTTPNPEFKSIDISVYIAGVTDAKIRFRWTGNYSNYWQVDNVIVYDPENIPDPAVAVSPLNGATDVDINTALEWSAGSGSAPTGYRLYFGTDGGGATPPTNIEDNTDLLLSTTYIPSAPLLYAETYYWMVVPYNASGEATGNEIWSFTVMADPPVTVFPYLEDFEASFPPLYYIRYTGLLSDPVILTSTNSGWEQADWRNISSPVNKAAKLNISGTSQSYWLATTLIDLGTGIDYQFEFDLTLNAAGTSDPPDTTGTDDKFAVVISTDGGATWETTNVLKLWDNTGSTNVYNEIDLLGEHITIDLSDYAGIIQLAFYGESTIANADNDLMIDNIEIKEIPILAPVFSINPASLDFGEVAVGDTAELQATVSNTGTADLIIFSIISSDGQFGFNPASLPFTITPDSEHIIDISFTPGAAGTQSATLEITHNATGSPDLYPVLGTGVDEGPTFIINPSSLNFGSVEVNTPNNLILTVSNIGLVNTLNVIEASVEEPGFSVTPNAASIGAGQSQIFTVTFNPSDTGEYSGNLIFTTNDAASPHTVPLAGNGVNGNGLLFEKDTVYQLEDNSYVQILQLLGMDPFGEEIQAIQFRLSVNKEDGDNTILTFQNIEKGSDVAGEDWVLDYNLFRGPITGNGASVDSAYVLLYNLNQDSGLDPSLDYTDLLRVKYRIARLPALIDTTKSTFRISNAEATTREGFPIDITSSRTVLTVMALNGILSHGDVNGDGYLDILDLILVVDHIVGRDSLEGDYFTRADISPWIQGIPEPEPDGFVNVQDLSLIQNIILTGVYPDSTINGEGGILNLPKVAGDIDAKVTFYINDEGISVYIDSKADIRGAQIELDKIKSNPQSISISTDLGRGYYYKAGNLLRTVLYDRLANKFIKAGEHFMADIPIQLNQPDIVQPVKVILVDTNKKRLEKTQIEIVYGNAPLLPLDYILYQNYPNPFNPSTTVKFQVPQTCFVTVNIFDLLGQKVRTLFSEQVYRGTYEIKWDGLSENGKRMSSGTYIYMIVANDFIRSKKMLLLK